MPVLLPLQELLLISTDPLKLSNPEAEKEGAASIHHELDTHLPPEQTIKLQVQHALGVGDGASIQTIPNLGFKQNTE